MVVESEVKTRRLEPEVYGDPPGYRLQQKGGEMKLGFTGTQKGMTSIQKTKTDFIIETSKPEEAHHGDCIGSDETFNALCRIHTVHIPLILVCHPPLNPSKRAWTVNDITLPEKEYLERNHDIVDAVDTLLATPKEMKEQLRSGTWATIRYARGLVQVITILPNGVVIYE